MNQDIPRGSIHWSMVSLSAKYIIIIYQFMAV